jgi:hypothetical protein
MIARSAPCAGSVVRTLDERFQICAEKVVDRPARVIVIPSLHHGPGVAEGLDVCRLRGPDRGEEEIDAWRVQCISDGDVVETGCRKGELDRRRCLLEYEAVLVWIVAVAWTQVVGVATAGKVREKAANVYAMGCIEHGHCLLARCLRRMLGATFIQSGVVAAREEGADPCKHVQRERIWPADERGYTKPSRAIGGGEAFVKNPLTVGQQDGDRVVPRRLIRL